MPEGVTKAEAAAIARALLAHRTAVVAQLETLGVEVASLSGEPADVATAIEQTDASLSRRAALMESLRSIDRALDRISEGTYGACVECGSPIAPKRLEAMPDADRCITCQDTAEREADQPGAPERVVRARRPRSLEEA